MYDIRWQRIWFVIVTLIGVLTIPLFLIFRGHTEDLRLSISANPCFLYRLYHLYCPGCGATRSVRFLIEGQFIDSLVGYEIVLPAEGASPVTPAIDPETAQADGFIPLCKEYQDVQDLLFADPIHEVDVDTGWQPE